MRVTSCLLGSHQMQSCRSVKEGLTEPKPPWPMRMSSPLAVLLMVMSEGSSCHPSCSISGHELVMLRERRPQLSQRSTSSRESAWPG